MLITKENLAQYQSRYRATLINSLAGYKQAVLVGTRSQQGSSNLAIFNSLIHLGADPALWAFISRPAVVNRHTLDNILETGNYTFNYVSSDFAAKAHQTSAKYPDEVSEFAAAGFEEQYLNGWEAPFAKEAVVKVAMKFEEKINIQLNGTIMIIGSLQFVELSPNLFSSDGFVNIHDADVLACTGLDAYFRPQLLDRFTYAQPDKNPEPLILPHEKR